MYQITPALLDQMLEALDSLRAYLPNNPGDGAARFVAYCAANIGLSAAQLFQDLFVAFVLDNKRDGFFVEFGAADGLFLSNTLLLERQMGWRGILSEPARTWTSALRSSNRTAAIDTRCVWSRSGETITFNETQEPEFSTVNAFSDKDKHAVARESGVRYEVETISLNDLLDFHKAPSVMDYLSIDTEGSELLILENLDFARYRFNIITVEHNYAEPTRTGLLSLLTGKGYVRVFENFSKWDDWYVHRSILTPTNG